MKCFWIFGFLRVVLNSTKKKIIYVYRSYDPLWLRDSVSPVYGIFLLVLTYIRHNIFIVLYIWIFVFQTCSPTSPLDSETVWNRYFWSMTIFHKLPNFKSYHRKLNLVIIYKLHQCLQFPKYNFDFARTVFQFSVFTILLSQNTKYRLL